MSLRRRFLLTVLGAASMPISAVAAAFRDPLDVPAVPTRLFASGQLAAVALAGRRVVACGIRGLVIVSDDGGKQWRQARVPVSTELVSLQFVDEKQGWIVGHGGVVLHTVDGGLTWAKQLDGRQTAQMLKEHFKASADQGDELAKRILADTELNYAEGPAQALLGVCFEDRQHGFVCGSFGTLLSTSDGGQTWYSWVERVDSRESVHLNAIRAIEGQIFMTSERGRVYRLDRSLQRFVAHETGYKGSLFGLVGGASAIVAFGLRGAAYRSLDGGGNWEQTDSGAGATINGGTLLSDGRLMLVTQDGKVMVGSAQGTGFRPLSLQSRGLIQDVVQVDANTAVLVGWDGPQAISLR